MKRLYLLLAFLVAGCGPVLLVNPKTGERVTCRHVDPPPGLGWFSTSQCPRDYEGLGYVRASDLTPEQRANLPKEGGK